MMWVLKRCLNVMQNFLLQLNDMKEWGITNTDDGEVLEAGSTIAAQDTADRIVDTSTSMYWTAPHSYLGNRVSQKSLQQLDR